MSAEGVKAAYENVIERLRAELAETKAEVERLREALRHFHMVDNRLAGQFQPGLSAGCPKCRDIIALLSAGPPQEVSPLNGTHHDPDACRGFDCATHGFQPAPGRRCTCGERVRYPWPGPHDPACPMHSAKAVDR